MSKRAYRLCLFLILLVVAWIGIGYYYYLKEQLQNPEGAVLVWEEMCGTANGIS